MNLKAKKFGKIPPVIHSNVFELADKLPISLSNISITVHVS